MAIIPNPVTVLAKQAATPVAGFALVNATPTILSWSVPNDGQMHRFAVYGYIIVSSLETGGQINVNFTDMSGVVRARDAMDANQAAGWLDLFFHGLWPCQAGSTVTVTQQSALTGGAATLWAEIWGS